MTIRGTDWRLVSAAVGAAIWAAGVAVARPSPFDVEWGQALLALAPLSLVPLSLRLADRSGDPPVAAALLGWAARAQLPCAVLFAASFFLSEGDAAAAMTLPWLAVVSMVSLAGLLRIGSRGLRPWPELSLDAALVFLAVGGAWATASRWGMRPMGFEPVIVLLTGIHFHYAGLALPLMAGLAGRASPGPASDAAAIAVVAGVPLTAAGITATQLGTGPALETVAAVLTSGAGMLTGWLHLRLVGSPGLPAAARAAWGLVAASLAISMALSATYGLRFAAAGGLDWLTIERMRALHGTANALGFAAAGLVGWTLASIPPATATTAAATATTAAATTTTAAAATAGNPRDSAPPGP